METKTETFVASLTQYVLPNGLKKAVETDLPVEVQPLYDDMLAHNHWLETEVLRTGEVSTTVTNDEIDVDHSITPNGPKVQPGIVAMLKRKAWLGA